MHRLSRQIFLLAGVLLVSACGQAVLLFFLLKESGGNDLLVQHTDAIRIGVQRYAKLELAFHPVAADGLVAEMQARWSNALAPPTRFTPYGKEQREFRASWSNELPRWEEIRRLGLAFRARPDDAHREALLAASESFRSGRILVNGFLDELQNKRALFLGSLASAALFMILGVGVLLAVNLYRIRRHLEPVAHLDALTGALSRGAFVGGMHRLRPEHEGILLMVDLDHFKRVNDRYGHGVGDAALRELVAGLRAELREQDLLGRVGGEEFAIWLPGLDPDVGHQVAERLRNSVACRDFPGPGALTISIGLCRRTRGMKWDHLYREADRALYQAKESGRNRVVAAPDPG